MHDTSGSRTTWRSLRQAAVVSGLVAAVVLVSWLLSSARKELSVPPGTLLHARSLCTMDGFPCSLDGYRIVVVVSADCPSCFMVCRMLERAAWGWPLHTGGVALVSLSTALETRRHFEGSTTRFPFLLASAAEVREAWRVRRVPTLFLLDEKGRVTDVLVGARCLEEGPAAVAALAGNRSRP